ncbi:hypothetical protein [Jeotgalibacillus marinus]|uniref:Bulb-type lectin domain-containing protein n=1 Tax=Jeotgalibacillus marinus TaxID=86667 RepID=A0ABV3Q801_9BACL
MKKMIKLFMALLLIFTLNTPVGAYASTEEEQLEHLDINELSSNDSYTMGENPSITVLDNGLVVSVNDRDGKLSYQLGEYEEDKMHWTPSVEYGGGEKPTISTLDNGDIIEVHEGGNHELHYNLGRYEDGTINWYSVNNFYGLGDHPNVEVLTTGDIVLVFEGQQVDNTGVYYEYGTFENDKVTWYKNGIEYDKGLQPSVTALANGQLLKTHKSVSDSYLWASVNRSSVDNHSVSVIGAAYEFEPHSSNNPVTIQLDNGSILSMFDSNQSNGTWNQMGKVEYYPGWGSGAVGEASWVDPKSDTYTHFHGKNNDVVQLQNGLLLNVHEDHDSDEINYVIGRYDDNSNRVFWGDHVPLEYLNIDETSAEAIYNSIGQKPSMTVLDNGLVLAVSYRHQWITPKMYYQLGEYLDGKMYWTDPKEYDNGANPSIATLPNGDVIEVHSNHNNGGDTTKHLYYNLGKYENGSINWYSIGNKYDRGLLPKITVTSDGDIVEVHSSGNARASGKLFYNYGSIINIDSDKVDISWGTIGEEYGAGYEASVSASADGLVLKTRKSNDDDGHLWYSINEPDRTNNTLDRIGSSMLWEPHDVNSPVSYQLDNGEVLMMFHRGISTWFQMASYRYGHLLFETPTINDFDGQFNDVVQLKNGLILNVHEVPKHTDKLRYVLGEYDEEQKRITWLE